MKKYGNIESTSISPCKSSKMFHPGSLITLPSVPIFKLEIGRAAYGREKNDFRMLGSGAWINFSSAQWPFSRIKNLSTGQCKNSVKYTTVSVPGNLTTKRDQESKQGGEEKKRIKVKQNLSLTAGLDYGGRQFHWGDFKSLYVYSWMFGFSLLQDMSKHQEKFVPIYSFAWLNKPLER